MPPLRTVNVIHDACSTGTMKSASYLGSSFQSEKEAGDDALHNMLQSVRVEGKRLEV